MTELVCLRSLWQTLTAAASTFALFAAANWGTAAFIAEEKILNHTFLIMGVPLFSLCFSVWNASEVWMVKSFLGTEENSPQLYDSGSIAIITLCPIYIKIARALTSEEQLLARDRGWRSVTDSEELKDVCPLELRPAGGTGNTDGASGGTMNATAPALHEEDSTQWTCFQLPDTSFDPEFVNAGAERLVLLSCSLAPTYKELSFIRSRNTFQSVVTTLQAGGYMLSVLQRVVQRLGISPVEAIVTFLCINVALQLLIELYACGNYQRPLLIRLDARQFERFRDAPRKDFQARKRENVVGVMVVLMSSFISIPAIYYFSHYMHTYLVSALSALLFFLAVVLFGTFMLHCFSNILIITSMFLYVSSLIVAVVSTIVDWKAFHNPVPHNWFAWILPHASS